MSAKVIQQTMATRRAVCFMATALAAVLLAAVSLDMFVPSVASATQPTRFNDYVARVREARLEVSRAQARIPDAHTAEELANRLSSLLPRTEVVEVTDGHLVVVDNAIYDSLVISLKVAPNGPARAGLLEDIRGHLESMERGLWRSGRLPAEDPEALAQLLGTERAKQRSALSEAFSRLVERVGIALQRWWATVGGSPVGRTAMRGVTLAVLLGMALIVLVVGARVVLRVRRGVVSAPRATPQVEGPVATVFGAEGSPGDPLACADALAASGETREALRTLFADVVRTLVECGFVAQSLTRTNAELLREVQPHSQVAYEPLARLCRKFDCAWYGHHVPGAEAFASARADYLEALAALRGGFDAALRAAASEACCATESAGGAR